MDDLDKEFVIVNPQTNAEEVHRILLDPATPVQKAVAEVLRRGLAVEVNREPDA